MEARGNFVSHFFRRVTHPLVRVPQLFSTIFKALIIAIRAVRSADVQSDCKKSSVDVGGAPRDLPLPETRAT